MQRKYTVTRNVSPIECHWLSRTYEAGETLYRYDGCTYGCIDHDAGIACTEQPDTTPFFQFPYDALKEMHE